LNTVRNDKTETSYCSRQADKFVLRFQNEDRVRAAQLARKRYMSMNSYVVRAIDAFLDGADQQELLIDLIKSQLPQAPSKPQYDSPAQGKDRFVIRMSLGSRTRIQEIAKARKLSMNTLLVQILRQQLALDEEFDALMDSLVRERQPHSEPQSA
jgi:predicted HicB family RNase H-like nuclease